MNVLFMRTHVAFCHINGMPLALTTSQHNHQHSTTSIHRFDIYLCTTAERQYALEAWRLLDPKHEVCGFFHASKQKARRFGYVVTRSQLFFA